MYGKEQALRACGIHAYTVHYGTCAFGRQQAGVLEIDSTRESPRNQTAHPFPSLGGRADDRTQTGRSQRGCGYQYLATAAPLEQLGSLNYPHSLEALVGGVSSSISCTPRKREIGGRGWKRETDAKKKLRRNTPPAPRRRGGGGRYVSLEVS